MENIFVDKNYNIIKNREDSYSDEIDINIDSIIAAIGGKTLTEEEGIELLKILLFKDLTNGVSHLAAAAIRPRQKRALFVSLFDHSSSIEKYV